MRKSAFIAVVILLCLVFPSMSEETGGFVVVPAQNDLWFSVLARVDVLPDAAFCADAVSGKFPFAGDPAQVLDLFLYDGWHICHGWWAYDQGGFLVAGFPLGVLDEFDSTVGIYLVAIMSQ